MNRNINYPGQVPLETDLLKTNQFTMVGLAKLAAAILGTATCVNGFAVSQTVVPSMSVLVQPGEIYSMQNLEATAYSSLPADTAHSILKQGIALDTLTIPLAAPGTVGFSVNYLIQASYQDQDTGSTVLPYYNASNPAIAYSGPANSGVAQPTTRAGGVVISAKAGTAAVTGTQTTPTPDAGFVGLYVVTVANGASTIVNANISAYPLAPFIPSPFVNRYARFTSNGTFVAPWYVTTVYISGCGAGSGGGGGGGATNQLGTGAGGAGGGAGQAIIRQPFNVTPGASYAVTIGTAGTAGAPGNPSVPGGNGSSGGATIVAGLVTLNGASAATGGAHYSGGGTVAAGGTFSVTAFPAGQSGSDGAAGFNGGVGCGGMGASGPFGGGGGGGRSGSTGVSASNAVGFGAGGGGGGGGYGSGGGGANGGTGGNGGGGFVFIEW